MQPMITALSVPMVKSAELTMALALAGAFPPTVSVTLTR